MSQNDESVGVTPQGGEADEKYGYECMNCLSLTTEKGECVVCGAPPFDGDGYRVECLECGAVEYGDQGDNAQWDMTYHRIHHCKGASFEVTAQ